MRGALLVCATVSLAFACAAPLEVGEGEEGEEGEGEAVPLGLAFVDDAEPGEVDAACGARTLFSVRAQVVDEAGAPVGGARLQMCTHGEDGSFACLRPAESDGAGNVVVEVPERARCLERVVARVSAPAFATITCGVDLAGADTTPSFSAPLVVPRVSTTLPAGLALDGEGVAAAASAATCVSAAAPVGTAKLWALAPEEAGGVNASVTGLTPGARVRAHVLGGLDCRLPDGSLIERGAFAEVAAGEAGADGSFFVGGLPCLTWLAVSVE